ncbi:hypothetical protein ACX27O_22190 [Micromonospora sp. SD19]
MSRPDGHRGFQEAESIKRGGQEAESIKSVGPGAAAGWVVTRARPAQNGSVERRRDE